MKSVSNIIFSILLLVGIFCSGIYFSCSKDSCNTVTCLNKGTCSAGICQCPTGWVGNFCETSAFIGNWIGKDLCDSINYNFSISIDPSSKDTVTFYIKTPHGYSSEVVGTRKGATVLNIKSQFCDTVMLSGAITLVSDSSLTFSYTLTDTNSVAHVKQCSGNYMRK